MKKIRINALEKEALQDRRLSEVYGGRTDFLCRRCGCIVKIDGTQIDTFGSRMDETQTMVFQTQCR